MLTKLSFSIACLIAFFPAEASFAQVTPDGSVPTTLEQLKEIMRINGGEREGNNLFHSFEEFSIPEGMEAVFENSTDIQNIFARVTGNELSQINGILSTQGDANFFFINPNGIIFGDNAQLNVGGSFLASTAETIQFDDGTEFSASDENQLLTVSFPVGLGLGSNPGSITVNGNGNQITKESPFQPIEFEQKPEGLSVPSGKTLALIGNGINFNGGVVTTEGGEISLTSVDSGSVSINQNNRGLTFVSNGSSKYQDINLAQQSLINTNGEEPGTISLVGNNINLLDASFVLAQNQASSGESSIDFEATGTLSLSGRVSNISSNIRSEALNAEEGADINISANQLKVGDQGQIQAASFGKSFESQGGNITINVPRAVDLNSGLISASTFSEGNAGNVELSTSKLQLTNISSVTSSTVGIGNGGNVIINADFIKLIGSTPNSRSTISASSLGAGNAGNLKINTQQLQVEEGASFSSSSFGNGNAGDISIDASKSITLNGSNSNFQSNTEPQGSTIRTSVQSVSPIGQEMFGLPAVPTGKSGNLTINTPELNVLQKGVISVENQGTGDGGTLSINADQTNLSEGGRITATSVSGNGGNINLDIDDLQIDDGSQITATAENNGNGGNITINTSNLSAKKNSNLTTSAIGGNGGNITIDTETLLGLQNSDITANAIAGNGGNITINSDYIFGLDSRTELTPFSDITASSELGIDGTVTIFSPENNIEEEVTIVGRKERALKDEDLVDEKCSDYGQQRVRVQDLGSPIAPSPFDFPYSEDLPGEQSPAANSSPASDGEAIVQANTVKVLPDGRTFLVAETKSNHPVTEPQLCTRQ